MKFKGDIIITDPCYIIKSEEDCAKEKGVILPEHPSFETDYETYNELLDKYYMARRPYNDWERCDYGENMEALGFTSYISESTLYGDWSCSTWSTPRKDVEAQLEELNTLGKARWELMKQYGEDSVQAKIYDDKIADASLNIKKIGDFCADAGMVAVFLLDEVLKYNPSFDYHINRKWTTTLIEGFDGEVDYYCDTEGDAHIIGVGNINFFTTQTGF